MTAVLDPTSATSIQSVCTTAIADSLASPQLMHVRRRNGETNTAFVARRRERVEELAADKLVATHHLDRGEAIRFVRKLMDATAAGLHDLWGRVRVKL